MMDRICDWVECIWGMLAGLFILLVISTGVLLMAFVCGVVWFVAYKAFRFYAV